jgi:hypothetical protein
MENILINGARICLEIWISQRPHNGFATGDFLTTGTKKFGLLVEFCIG